jgi:flavodoxin
MKRRISLLSVIALCLAVLMLFSACGTADNSSSATEAKAEASQAAAEKATEADTSATSAGLQETEAETVNTTLVVYFSHTGTTKGVAEYLHGLVGGDIIELEPVNAYPEGYSDALDPAKQEQNENARPAIKTTIENFDSYDTIYMGYPIWWGTVPMLMFTFMESYDFSGKTVVPFSTSGGTGIEQSMSDIRDTIPDADVKDGLLVRDNDEILPWLQGLGLHE